MIILPSIDIINGFCVRLKQGDFAQQTTYKITPDVMAKQFKTDGAKGMHVVDLQGAKCGKITQFETITAIRSEFGDGVQVGGGVRSRAEIDALLAIGVQRVVLGTHIISVPEEIPSLIHDYGTERLVFALDVRVKSQIPYVAISGWQSDSQVTLWAVLEKLPPFAHVLCTDIGQDGMQKGPNLRIYEACVAQYPELNFQASGGISSLEDIENLKRIKVHAAIIGKALYEKTLILSEAIACSSVV